MHFAMIEKNIYLVTIVRKKGNLSGIRVPNSTYTFRNYKETKELQAMKLHALLTSSGSYIVAKFQLVNWCCVEVRYYSFAKSAPK